MNHIEKAVGDFALLEPGEKVVAGVSGGADSVAMLHWLVHFSGCSVVVCHLNHSLRGAESDRDEQFVRALCAEWKIPCFVERADVRALAQEKGLTLEEAGRECRYAFFEKIRREQQAQKIATAHTLSDNVETLLLRLSRGTGLTGLCGIPAQRGRIIRPLLLCTRSEIEEYCREHGLSYVTDSTNLEGVYARNQIRLDVIPKLKRQNPELETAIGNTIAILKDENDLLDQLTAEKYTECRQGDGLSCERLSRLAKALMRRVLAHFLEEQGLSKSFSEIEQLCGMAASGRGKLTVADGCTFAVEHGILQKERAPLSFFEEEVMIGGSFWIGGKRYLAELCPADCKENPQKVYKNLLYLCLDYDKINGKLKVRQRKPGDRISAVNRGGSKTIKKLFIDEKLTAWEKSIRPVFADDSGVAAVWEYGPDERCRVDAETKQILYIIQAECTQDEKESGCKTRMIQKGTD